MGNISRSHLEVLLPAMGLLSKHQTNRSLRAMKAMTDYMTTSPARTGPHPPRFLIWQEDIPTHGMRNELYLRSRTGVRASVIAFTCAEGSESISSRQPEGKLSWSDGGRGRRSSCQTRSTTWVGQRLGPRPIMLFMALFMTRSWHFLLTLGRDEGEVHELGLGVSNFSHRALSDPLSEKSERIERACEATSAEGTARCASRGMSHRTHLQVTGIHS